MSTYRPRGDVPGFSPPRLLPGQLVLGVCHLRGGPNYCQQEQHHQQQHDTHEGDLSHLEDNIHACRL